MTLYRRFTTFDDNLPCHCEPRFVGAWQSHSPLSSPRVLRRPALASLSAGLLAKTEGGIAKLVPKHERGISLLATTKGKGPLSDKNVSPGY
jgi:hypothetical protein